MPQPLAICLEDIDPRDPAQRYLRCVALVGRQPGLRVDDGGAVVWKPAEFPACELWVSADDRLILYRTGAVEVTVHRAGRSLEVPSGKPVVVLDQDSFVVNGRRLRIHVHGPATAVAPPSPLRPAARRTAAGVAAAVALSAAALTGCDGLLEIRDMPPEVAPVQQPIQGGQQATPAEPATPVEPVTEEPVTEEPVTEEPVTPAVVPIEVRMEPPDMAMPEEPPAEPSVPAEPDAEPKE